MSFARGDATARDRERASKLSSLKKHVNRSPAEGDRDRGSRPRDAEPSQHTGAEGGQKQLTLSVCKKQKNPPKSVIERPGEACRACAAPGRRRVREGRSADPDDRVPSCRLSALNRAGAASAVSGPCPPTGFSESRPEPARWTLNTVGAEAAVRYVKD